MAGKEKTAFGRTVDAFCRALFLTEDGRPKSAAFLYSFCLAILFLLLYLLSYLLLLDPLERLFAGVPAGLRNLMEILLPALAGSVPCVCLFFPLKKNRNLVPAAFLWLLVLLIGSMVMMLLLCDWSDGGMEYRLFLYLLAAPAGASLLIGGTASALLFRAFSRKEAAAAQAAEERASARPTWYGS